MRPLAEYKTLVFDCDGVVLNSNQLKIQAYHDVAIEFGANEQQAQALVAQLNSGDGVLVLSDMYGATPCNIVTKLWQPGMVAGVAGVNLPMLVRAMTYRHEPLNVVIEKALSGGREGVVQFTSQQCERYEQGSSQ